MFVSWPQVPNPDVLQSPLVVFRKHSKVKNRVGNMCMLEHLNVKCCTMINSEKKLLPLNFPLLSFCWNVPVPVHYTLMYGLVFIFDL